MLDIWPIWSDMKIIEYKTRKRNTKRDNRTNLEWTQPLAKQTHVKCERKGHLEERDICKKIIY